MPLDRGILSQINEEILSALGDEEGSQLVRVPVSDVFWSTWRAYCDAVGVPMGRGIAALIASELHSVVEEDLERLQVLLRQRQEELSARAEELSAREKELAHRERLVATREEVATRKQARLEDWEARLREWEERLGTEARRPSDHIPIEDSPWLSPHVRTPGRPPKVGRNDPCPCGSGEKYKRCHGRGR